MAAGSESDSFVVAAVFILAASRLAFLHRTVFVSALVHGTAVNLLMSARVLPLSATPKLPVTALLVAHGLTGDALFVGLPPSSGAMPARTQA